MGDGFPRGAWGDGSHGDPGPDVVLPAVTAEDLLNGHFLLVPGEFRPLADTVTALCGPPSAAELRGEAQARAAYRTLRSGALDDAGVSSHTLPLELRVNGSPRGRRSARAAYRTLRSGALDDPGVSSHTLPLELRANGSPRGRRSARARHRSTASTRPPSRRGQAGRLGLISGVAAAVIAAVAGFAYAGGAFSAHVKTPNAAVPPSSVRPSDSASGHAGVAGVSASQAPASKPAPTGTAGASHASAETGQAMCAAWLQNPWRPGVKNWDDDDFDKLSALAGGPQLVLFYCWTKLPRDYWGPGPALHYPPGYSNGHWDWTPGSKPPAPGAGPSPGGDSGPGGNPGSGNGNSGNDSTGNGPAGPQNRP